MEVIVGYYSSTFSATLAFFTSDLGFRVETIYPADGPTTAVIAAHGVRLRLTDDVDVSPMRFRIKVEPAQSKLIPGTTIAVLNTGVVIDVVDAHPPLMLPPLAASYEIARLASTAGGFTAGRAGMLYRDLVPTRCGGRYIASHIKILDEGPVPDYVHWHDVRFQMIYVVRGSVEVVYEGQGPAFTMVAGDCVLQPPTIRHRVLHASAGLEVVEIGCPAIHATNADAAMVLPSPSRYAEDYTWRGQRFCRFISAEVPWERVVGPSSPRLAGFERRDVGFAAATVGVASAIVARAVTPSSSASSPPLLRAHNGEFVLRFVLSGTAVLVREGEVDDDALAVGDSVVVPAGIAHALHNWSDSFAFLEVSLPGTLEWS